MMIQQVPLICGFHSINVPSEWGHGWQFFQHLCRDAELCFHSINVPSEWGHYMERVPLPRGHGVSIQLMSPASGDSKRRPAERKPTRCFHSINVPSEWGLLPNTHFLYEL